MQREARLTARAGRGNWQGEILHPWFSIHVCSAESHVEREGEVLIHLLRRRGELALRRAMGEKAGETAAFGFVAVVRESLMAQTPGMRDVILAAAERAFVPGVVEVEHERGVDADGRLEAVRRLPRAVADAGHAFAVRAGGMEC